MRHASLPSSRPAWWSLHQQALQLFRDLDALQRVRPSLLPGTLAWRQLDREQAVLDAAIAALIYSARSDR